MEELNSSTPIAFHIITDRHIHYTNKSNRYDYVKEIDFVFDKVREQVIKYKERGFLNVALYLGDIFDRSYRSCEMSMSDISKFQKELSYFDRAFSVIGNHEFTYYNSNPFWFQISEINSKRASNFKNFKWRAKGVKQNINIVDKLVVGDVEFLFNHYGCGILSPDKSKTSIGLFHQDIYFKGIIEEAKRANLSLFSLNEEIIETKFKWALDDDNELLDGYDYSYFGHNHLLYGEWVDRDKNASRHYLSTLGRTAHTEVLDEYLERNIPVIIIEDGKFKCKEDNIFNLPNREQCVMEDLVKAQKEKYEKKKDRVHLLLDDIQEDNPIESLKSYFNNIVVNQIVEEILDESIDSIYSSCSKMFREEINNE